MEGGGRGLGGGLGCRSGDGDPVWDELAHTQGNVDGGGLSHPRSPLCLMPHMPAYPDS